MMCIGFYEKHLKRGLASLLSIALIISTIPSPVAIAKELTNDEGLPEEQISLLEDTFTSIKIDNYLESGVETASNNSLNVTCDSKESDGNCFISQNSGASSGFEENLYVNDFIETSYNAVLSASPKSYRFISFSDRGADWYPTLDMLLDHTFSNVSGELASSVTVTKNTREDGLYDGRYCVDLNQSGTHTRIYLDDMIPMDQHTLSLLLSSQVDGPYNRNDYYGSTFRIVLNDENSIKFELYSQTSIPLFEKTFYNANIQMVDITRAEVSSIAPRKYTGSRIEPYVEVSLDGEAISGPYFSDGHMYNDYSYSGYILLYEDNVNVGTAKAIVQGIGRYYGRIEIPFSIGAGGSMSMQASADCVVDSQCIITGTYYADNPDSIGDEIAQLEWFVADDSVARIKDVSYVSSVNKASATLFVTVEGINPGATTISCTNQDGTNGATTSVNVEPAIVLRGVDIAQSATGTTELFLDNESVFYVVAEQSTGSADNLNKFVDTASIEIEPRNAINAVTPEINVGSWSITEDGNKATLPITLNKVIGDFDGSVITIATPAQTIELQVRSGDSDLDGLPDKWELYGLDINDDGVVDVDLPAMGAVVGHKDLYVQVDSMEGRAPTQNALDIVAKQFMSHGYYLHIDAGSNSKDYVTKQKWGSLSESKTLPFAEHFSVIWENREDGLLRLDDCDWKNAIEDFNSTPRRYVFRYCIFVNEFRGGRTGQAAGIPEQCFICAALDGLNDNAVAGTFMHELGHTLGLHHGGDDDANHKPNYLSVMNYSFQFGLLTTDQERIINYSEYVLPEIDEENIDERLGVDPNGVCSDIDIGTAWYQKEAGPDQDPPYSIKSIRQVNGIDFNTNGRIDRNPISLDLNGDGDDVNSATILRRSINDWDHLILVGGAIGDLGASSGSESIEIIIDESLLEDWSVEQAIEEGLYFADIPTTVASGVCGTCPWTIDSNGCLTIGEGTLAEYPGFGQGLQFGWLFVGEDFSYKSMIKRVVFSGPVKAPSTANEMFAGCYNLTSIDFTYFDTSSLTSASGMFSGCKSLKKINLSSFDTSKLESAYSMFENCSSLKSVDFGSWNTANLETISRMFYGCTSLESLDLSTWNTSSVTNAEKAFDGCSSLKSIKVGVAYSIPAFPNPASGTGNWWSQRDLAWFTSEEILSGRLGTPDVYTSDEVQPASNYQCYGIDNFYISKEMVTPESEFELWTSSDGTALVGDYCGMSPVVVVPTEIDGYKVVGLSDDCLAGIDFVTEVYLPDTLTAIASYAFEGCTSLQYVNLGGVREGLDHHGLSGLFKGCSSLKRLSMSDSASFTISLDDGSGNNFNIMSQTILNGLEYIYIGSSMVDVPINLFYGKSLRTVEIGLGNIQYSSSEGVVYSADGKTLLVMGIAYSGDYVVLDGCVSIGNYAFEQCSLLNKIYIPASVTSISDTAFMGLNPTIETPRGSYAATFAINNGMNLILLGPKLEQVITASDISVETGKSVLLNASTSGDGALSYESADASIATVDAFGTVTPVKPGSVQITITAEETSNYLSASKTITVTVIQGVKLITGAVVVADEQTYTGSPVTPSVTVMLGDIMLNFGTDFEVEYSNNVSAGNAIVTVVGIGNYSGVATGSFTIAPANISKVSIFASDQIYSGFALEPEVTVTLSDKELVEGIDFDVSFADNVAIGEAIITVYGKGNYTGTATGHFMIEAKPHSYVAVAMVPATCDEAGIAAYFKCSDCGKSFVLEDGTYIETTADKLVIPALGHDWDEGIVTTAPTCETDGVHTFTCKHDSSHTKTERIPAIGHSCKSVAEVPATCTEAGVAAHFKCSDCGKLFVLEGDAYIETTEDKLVLPALGHAWDQGVVTKPATETTEGEMTFTCTVCGETRTESIPTTDHTYVFVAEVPATCTKAGTAAHYKCSDCGKLFVLEGGNYFETSLDKLTIPALGHDWDEGTVTTAPTCETDGVRTFTCKNDASHTKTEVIPALGHTYGDWTVTKEATCTEAGSREKACSACGDKVVEEIAALGHDWDEGVVTTAPTCEADGVRTFTCKHDASHTWTETIPATGHTWDEGVVTTPATTTAEGVMTYTCTTCGETRTEAIPKLTPAHEPGWAKENGGWYFYEEDGTLRTGEWIQALGNWYYLGADGKLVINGWSEWQGKYYYMGSNGQVMKEGWAEWQGKYYYVKNYQVMKEGWIQYNGKYFYIRSYTPVVNDWVNYDGKWYHFNASGVCDRVA